MCESELLPSQQRMAAVGDTVKLEFVSVTGKNPGEFTIKDGPPNRACWSTLLKGKKAGDTVILPEAELNEVTAIILSIDR